MFPRLSLSAPSTASRASSRSTPPWTALRITCTFASARARASRVTSSTALTRSAPLRPRILWRLASTFALVSRAHILTCPARSSVSDYVFFSQILVFLSPSRLVLPPLLLSQPRLLPTLESLLQLLLRPRLLLLLRLRLPPRPSLSPLPLLAPHHSPLSTRLPLTTAPLSLALLETPTLSPTSPASLLFSLRLLVT